VININPSFAFCLNIPLSCAKINIIVRLSQVKLLAGFRQNFTGAELCIMLSRFALVHNMAASAEKRKSFLRLSHVELLAGIREIFIGVISSNPCWTYRLHILLNSIGKNAKTLFNFHSQTAVGFFIPLVYS
jgi:hypothetical protein